MRKIKEKIKLRTIINILPSTFFLIFLIYMMIRTFAAEEVQNTVKNTEMSFYGLEQLSDVFENTLQENFYDKNAYINLNGLTARVLRINTLNSRYKLSNGYLARTEDPQDTTEYSNNVIKLNDFLSEREIDFLYIQIPSKEEFYDVEYLPGYSSDGGKTIDSMVSSLTDSGVRTLDMNAWFENNGWTIEDVFFKTDHHWRPEAGLAAARATMDVLDEDGIAFYDKDLLEDENYSITVLKDWFLGSHGKRVGVYYAGVDDISVYFPDFSTNYTYAGLHSNSTKWRISDSLLDLTPLDNKDYFNSDPYYIYLYEDDPIQVIKNTEAVNDKRVLVTGDSFRGPWEYFLASQFQEIYNIDLRSYQDGTFVQYVEEIQPDIVVVLLNPSGMTEDTYSFGTDEYLEALNSTTEVKTKFNIVNNVTMMAQENNADHFMVICSDLDDSQTYTLMIDSTAYTGGEDLYIQMTLQDMSTNTAVFNRYFDVNSNKTQKWIFTTPENDGNRYAIYLYSGTKGKTKNVSVEVSNIRLYEGVVEN